MITIGGRAHTIDEIRQVGQLNYPFVEINLDDPIKIESQLDLKEKYGIHYLAHYPNEGNSGDLKTLGNVFVPKVKKLIELSSNLKMTMDIGHGQLLSKENTAFGFMAHAFEKIEHIHVHDNLGGTGVKDDLHLPLNLHRIFSGLA